MLIKRAIIALLVLSATNGFAVKPDSVVREDTGIEEVFKQFQNPSAEARPFVRWWWNGNQVEEQEILRELDVLKKAGIGGVEINPIANPGGPASKAKELTWRSEEWDRMLHVACKGAKERGMIVDLIAGSGWPFGGEFLEPEQQIMRVVVIHDKVDGPSEYRKDMNALSSEIHIKHHGKMRKEKLHNPTLEFVMLFPEKMTSVDQVRFIDLPTEDKPIAIDIPAGKHIVAYGLKQTGYRKVVHGAKGAMGPTMDHMQSSVTRAYMNRLKGVEDTWGEPLSTYVRAIFCDSIETGAANWTHDVLSTFKKRKGYDVKPYLPFVMKASDVHCEVKDEMKDTLQRVRYDWNEHVVSTFLENFTQEYHDWCNKNKLLSRYQAYGTPYLMGMAEGYMIPDIPESNNWLDSGRSKNDQYYDEASFTCSYEHGYMIWTKYTSAGARLRGKKIASTEAMTKTRKVFNCTMGKIKQADDANFVAGMTHSVLHGFNYNPPDVPFPGRTRYGAYFSEHNTWWPHFKLWTDYNARLSAVFQATAPVAGIALIGPTPDLWSTEGLVRGSFHATPFYFHKLWEPIAQLGGNCDYLHGAVIQNAKAKDGLLKTGPMSYKALIVAEMKSMLPETAKAIQKFAASGGKVIYVKNTPERSPGFKNADKNDLKVKEAVRESLDAGAKLVDAPDDETDLRGWVLNTLAEVDYDWKLKIEQPRDGLYHVRQKSLDEDILFFANTYREEVSASRVDLDLGDKGLWHWNPETGERTPYAMPYDENGFNIHLKPLESVLIVTGKKYKVDPKPTKVTDSLAINGPWKVTLEPAQSGKPFTLNMDTLKEFTQDERLAKFSGVASYETTFNVKDKSYTHIELGKDNDFISEIWLNGTKVGVNWYGIQHLNISDALKKGKNELRIEYTTTLYNMLTTQKGIRFQPKGSQRTGLLGPVKLLKK